MPSGLPAQSSPWEEPAPLRIEGQKVVLREKRLEDAENDHTWRSDPELAAFDAVPPLRLSLAEYLRLYKEELRHPSPRHQTIALEDKEGHHIGNIMYYDVDEAKGQAELGIMIGRKDYWSQGYGTEAVLTLISYLFTTTQLQRLYLHTLKWNVRAQRAFQKAGFTAIGEVERAGHIFIAMEIFRNGVVLPDNAGEALPGDASVTRLN